ncbi:coiled-coil domain-containing protein 171 isoform X2 [Patella vulgata]|uniref:coiled-coil domain-containing protein 171 isoform X2 n=1 Tax=Patella vulgata TaxID=6465 RepID=UPI0021809189|nr:coiled-coil domain-containing protein 171 isoform X2 [Patella vulgata]
MTTESNQMDGDIFNQANEDNDFKNQQIEDSPIRSAYRHDVSVGMFSPMNASNMTDASGSYQPELTNLRLQLRQTKIELQSEQDQVSQLRRRLNTAEKERLEATSKSNTEVANLESQQARLRTQIEKGEANRHNLEYELTRVKRDWSQHKQAQLEKENVLMATNDELKVRVKELSDEIKSMQKKMHSLKTSTEDSDKRLSRDLEEKNHLLARYHAEQEVLRTERDKLSALALQQESVIGELTDNMKDQETEMKNHTENLRRTLSELDYSKERETRLKTDLELSLQRIKTLEDNIELERAAHLETKFNSEIVQLRARDLEGGVEIEKSTNLEATKSIERLTRQIRELEQSYEGERKMKRDAVHKLDRTEKDYVNIRRQLTSEVDDKKHVINKLSKELEAHQRNLNELKEELNKAKKRQVHVEDTYGGSLKEVEELVQNFALNDKPKRPILKTKKDDGKLKKTGPNPTQILENLKRLLTEYKKKTENTAEELSKCKKISEKQLKELENTKEMVMVKDKSLEDTQKKYTRTAKELNRVRSDYGELEGLLARMQVDLQTTSSYSDRDRTRIQELSGEIMKLVSKQKEEEEDRINFLHGLYQQLLSGPMKRPVKDKGFKQLTFCDLSDMVYQQVTTLVSALQEADEKLKTMEETVLRKEVSLQEIQNSSEVQIQKLTSLTKERELSWQKQKDEIEAHYSKLLSDLQSRSKKNQTIADQAWEKVRATGNVQQGLQSECYDLTTKLQDVHHQNSALLAACALLSGVLFPLLSRSNELSSQRHIFEEQMTSWDLCTERALYLVNTLSAELKDRNKTPKKSKTQPVKRSPLLVFRVGVIAVMAANRLKYFGLSSTHAFVTYDAVYSGNGLLMCTGGVQPERYLFSDMNADESQNVADTSIRPGESKLVEWLSSPDLLDIVLTSMTELQQVAGQIENKNNPVETRALIGAARSSFTKLLERLSSQFPSVSLKSMCASRERHSTIRCLNRSLSKILASKPLAEKSNLASSQDLLMALQNHVLDLTSRLHKVEAERKQLIQDLNQLKSQTGLTDINKMEPCSKSSDSLKFVSMEKFERVCEELNSALHREQQAQHLLQEQSRQLTELSTRLELYATDGVERQQTLSETVQDLSELKSELKRKEQTIRQLNKQVMQYEFDKKSFQGNLTDAESALRTAAKDKEVLANYIKSIEEAFEEGKRQLRKPGPHEFTLSKLLLNSDLIPNDISKAGPELIACQNLVAAFIDMYHSSVSKIKSLEEEVGAHRQHVEIMKRELSDTIHREYSNQPINAASPDGYDLIHSISQQEFTPLKEDSEVSYCISKPMTPVFKKNTTTPNRKNICPSKKQYGTPKSHATRPRSSTSGKR